jgi:hypothetical protein
MEGKMINRSQMRVPEILVVYEILQKNLWDFNTSPKSVANFTTNQNQSNR